MNQWLERGTYYVWTDDLQSGETSDVSVTTQVGEDCSSVEALAFSEGIGKASGSVLRWRPRFESPHCETGETYKEGVYTFEIDEPQRLLAFAQNSIPGWLGLRTVCDDDNSEFACRHVPQGRLLLVLGVPNLDPGRYFLTVGVPSDADDFSLRAVLGAPALQNAEAGCVDAPQPAIISDVGEGAVAGVIGSGVGGPGAHCASVHGGPAQPSTVHKIEVHCSGQLRLHLIPNKQRSSVPPALTLVGPSEHCAETRPVFCPQTGQSFSASVGTYWLWVTGEENPEYMVEVIVE